jgi:membrane dipeptidase
VKPIFDAHLDLAWNALSYNRDLTLTVEQLRQRETGMTDQRSRGNVTLTLPELKRARVAACVGTLIARVNPSVAPEKGFSRTDLDYAHPYIASAVVHGQLAWYRIFEKQGYLKCIESATALESHWNQWQRDENNTPIGLILSMEGADPIRTPAHLEDWFEQGVRAIGLAHYGQGRYAGGTGSDMPLTPEGVELLRVMHGLGMILDVTHLCDKSLYQAVDAFPGPILASHHNCRAIVDNARQLSDDQIRLLIGRQAVIGVALDVCMIDPVWFKERSNKEIPLARLADHIDHICQLAGGAKHTALGTDLDGGFGREETPCDLDTCADLHKLESILLQRGYSDQDLDNIFFRNWLDFFLKNLPAT